MNEELKAKLLTYLASLEGAVKGTGDFVAEQAPLVVQEYILYMRVNTTLPLVFLVLNLLYVLINIRWLCRTPKETLDAGPPRLFLALGHAFLMFCVGPVVVGHNLDPCIKAWAAPRILVLDYIKEQIK